MDKDFLRQIDLVEELLPVESVLLNEETLICECFCVSVGDIRQLCKGEVDIEVLQKTLGLGNGCQNCINNVDSWVNKIF